MSPSARTDIPATPAPSRSSPAGRARLLRAAAVAALLAVGFLLQAYFLTRYPQPVLFGDPVGYYQVGLKFLEALGRVGSGERVAAVFESVRGYFYLFGVGSLFAVLERLRPGDLGFFRLVMAAFNTGAMLGAFLLGRRLSGSFRGGMAALVLAACYPPFALQAGRLYPDPLTGCLFVWAAWLYAEAVVRGSARWMLAAGLVLSAALLVRAQIATYVLLTIGAVLAVTARAWLRAPRGRALALALAIGLAPTAAAWAGIVWAVGKRTEVEQLGNFTFDPHYPYGFWQFLETDGWIGPYRLKQEPFFRALEKAWQQDRRLARSRLRQYAFAARYVAARPVDSGLQVLRNVYRLYDRPANDYKWDYPFRYSWQVGLQRLVVVLGVAAAALALGRRPALAGAFLIPAALAVLHGLVFPWPRYNMTAMPVLLAGAGAAAVALAPAAVAGWARRGRPPAPLVLAALSVLALVLAALLDAPAPHVARAMRWAGWAALLAVPFVLVARLSPGRLGRVAAAAGFAVVALPYTAHAIRDRLWHERLISVGDGGAQAVEQEIVLGPAAAGALRAAPEAFLVMDLRVPQGDLSRARLEIGAHTLPGSALVPTMPRLRESTATGGRDWRGYPQWYAVPFDPSWIPESGPLRVRLSNAGEPLVIGGDRFSGQQRVYEGPSFGDWPHWVALKLEYDGDYRIPVTRPLESRGSRSFVLDERGVRREVRGVHRMRIVTLRQNEGWLHWRTAPLPARGRAALAFSAWSGHRGEARLFAGPTPPLTLPLGARRRFDVESDGVRLCHVFEGERGEKAYGSYALIGDVSRLGTPGTPVTAELRFRTGMSDSPMFFVIDRKRPLADTMAALGACVAPGTAPVHGAAEILDATHNNYPEDTGRWTVDKVF